MNDLVLKLEIMVQRQGTLMWEDESVQFIWLGLGKLEGRESIHKNKIQCLGFEQSLTESW